MTQDRYTEGYSDAEKITDKLRIEYAEQSKKLEKVTNQRDDLHGCVDEMIRLVTDIRFAIGDNGKRMLDEFVEYAKKIKRDRDDLLAALEKQVADVKHCQQVMLNEVGIGFLDSITLANSEQAIASAKESA